LSIAYLVDTNILARAIRRKGNRWQLLQELVAAGGMLTCSAITVGELYAGLRTHEAVWTEELLAGFEEVPVTGAIAREAGRLKREWAEKGYTLALLDTVIAATAIQHGLTLVTENVRDFPMPELRLYSLPDR
jgi:predicted nucleic acid-binding protein